jgi:lipopolysaccharide transport system ATP-binding protein
MYVRLAFAVAAHLQPEILLVDEVLAVGDTAFQKKCLGKMGSVARQGRTILFVSHNMVAVSALCERGVLLEGGRVVADGPIGAIVDRYLRDVNAATGHSLADRPDRQGSQKLRFTNFEMRNAAGEPVANVTSGQDVTLAFRYEASPGTRLANVKIAVGVHGKFDESLVHLSNSSSNDELDSLPSSGTICCRLPRLPLQPGSYTFNLFCTVGEEVADWIQNAGALVVEPGDFFKSGRLPGLEGGPFLVDHNWWLSEDVAVRASQATARGSE